MSGGVRVQEVSGVRRLVRGVRRLVKGVRCKNVSDVKY